MQAVADLVVYTVVALGRRDPNLSHIFLEFSLSVPQHERGFAFNLITAASFHEFDGALLSCNRSLNPTVKSPANLSRGKCGGNREI